MKTCTQCHIELARNNHTWCKKCLLKSTQKWQKEYKKRTTPEERARQNKSYMLKAKYNITLADYENMLLNQNYTCKICGTETPGGPAHVFSVDHDHKIGQIRGLLCNDCNFALGLFKDSVIHLQSAINYLQ